MKYNVNDMSNYQKRYKNMKYNAIEMKYIIINNIFYYFNKISVK